MNIGGGTANMISPLQLVDLLRKMGAKFETKAGPGRAHEDMLFCTNYGEAERVLGWAPFVDVTDGVAAVYEWAIANRDALASIYESERS